MKSIAVAIIALSATVTGVPLTTQLSQRLSGSPLSTVEGPIAKSAPADFPMGNLAALLVPLVHLLTDPAVSFVGLPASLLIVKY